MSDPTHARPERWGAVSQLFHWISALLIVALGALGLYMTELDSPVERIRVYALHKSLGITLLAIVLLRLSWRFARRASAPGPIAGVSPWMHRAAGTGHTLLYAMMVLVPLTGWLLNSASGYPLQWFGRFNLPAIAGKDHDLHELAEDLHELGFWILVALVAGHVLAALYHHVFLGDGTLHRMLPWRRRVSGGPS